MNPLAIRARNYRTFAELDLQLPAGCVAILGPNGAGKSSLVNVIDLALFGPETRSWAPYLTQGLEGQRLELELVFEHDGATYRVRRGYSAAGSGKATLDLERAAPATPEEGVDYATVTPIAFAPLTRETAAATQAHLEEILGLTRETWRASAMLAQGDGAAFTEAQPRERKAILAKILGLDRYDVLLELVRRDARAATKRIDELNGELQRADRELAERPTVAERLAEHRWTLEDLTPKALAAETALAQAAQEANAGDALRRQKAEALAAAAEAAGRLQPLEERLKAADEAVRESAIAEDEIETIATPAQNAALEDRERELVGRIEANRAAARALEDAVQLRDARLAEKARIEREAEAAETKTLELDARASHIALGEISKCPTCDQTLGADAKATALQTIRVEAEAASGIAERLRHDAAAILVPDVPDAPELAIVDGIDGRPARADHALELVRERLAAFREAALQRSRLEGRLQVLRERVSARPSDAELEQARQAVQEARSALERVPPAPSDEEAAAAARAALTARSELDRIAAALTDARAREAVDAAAIERLDRIAEETEAAREERSARLVEVEALATLARAYGRDGIPSLIIANAAIPAIETEAARILAELGTAYRIELRTERALASGGTADALDVIVQTDAGERPYETFSGGERTRLNLALRIALARLLAHRRGAESRLLAIDEPEYLDGPGTAALAGVLKGLAGDFERVYLISHVPDLRDAFDATVEVVKGDDGLSRIGGSA